MNPQVLTRHGNYNRRDLRSTEIPSANGIGQVLGVYLSDDPREKALRDALYRCLGRLQ
jgi:hypothetical protein